MIKAFIKFVDTLVKFELALAAVLGFCIGGLVFISAVLRYVVGSPLGFSDELVALMFILASLFAFPYATRTGINIRLDVVTKRLSKTAQQKLAGVTTFIGLIILVIFVVSAIEEVLYSLEFNEVSEVSDIPIYPVKALAVFAVASTALALLANLVAGEGTSAVKQDVSNMIE